MKSDKEKTNLYNVIYVAIALILCLTCVFVGSSNLKSVENELEKKEKTVSVNEEKEEAVPQIEVYITGEVVNPGVYKMSEGARVQELVELAGGFTETADVENVNIVKLLKDGDHIKVAAIKADTSSAPKKSSGKTSSSKSSSTSSKTAAVKSTVTAYITGEVVNPGIYELTNGAKVQDLVDLAGGFTENANVESVNIIKVLKDGDHVKVPAAKNSGTAPEAADSAETEVLQININCGIASEYMKIDGITAEIAAEMIEYIGLYGEFQSVEELWFVESMTEELYAKVSGFFVVG